MYHVQQFFEGLTIDWQIPEGLSLLLGHNGGGKTRLLRATQQALPPGCVHLYGDYLLSQIRQGDPMMPWYAGEGRLAESGANLGAVLYDWELHEKSHDKREFVEEGLQQVFPWIRGVDLVPDVDSMIHGSFLFEPSQGLTRQSFSEAPASYLTTLLHLTALAEMKTGEVLAFEHVEGMLHPEPLSRLLEIFTEEAQRPGEAIVLTTQSPVVNVFTGKYEQVFLVDNRCATVPVPLLSVRNASWLAHFRLGDKFLQGALTPIRAEAE